MVFPDEPTRPGVRQLRAVSDPPPSGDTAELVGQLMREVMTLRGSVQALTAAQTTLTSEVSALRRDIELDRKELVRGAAGEASKNTSNRIAVLLGALGVLYQESAPYLHELWRMLHK